MYLTDRLCQTTRVNRIKASEHSKTESSRVEPNRAEISQPISSRIFQKIQNFFIDTNCKTLKKKTKQEIFINKYRTIKNLYIRIIDVKAYVKRTFFFCKIYAIYFLEDLLVFSTV